MSLGIDVDDDGLTPRQHDAIVKLLAGVTIKATAKAVGVSEKTLHDWLKDPPFKRAYRLARQFVVDQALTQLSGLARDAVATLKRNFKCKVPAVEVRAALGVLDKAINGQAMADMASELEELRTTLERMHGDARKPESSGGESPRGDHKPLPPDGGDTHPPPGPGRSLPAAGDVPGPVADAVPGGPVEAAGDVVLPPGGEKPLLGGSDVDALFD